MSEENKKISEKAMGDKIRQSQEFRNVQKYRSGSAKVWNSKTNSIPRQALNIVQGAALGINSAANYGALLVNFNDGTQECWVGSSGQSNSLNPLSPSRPADEDPPIVAIAYNNSQAPRTNFMGDYRGKSTPDKENDYCFECNVLAYVIRHNNTSTRKITKLSGMYTCTRGVESGQFAQTQPCDVCQAYGVQYSASLYQSGCMNVSECGLIDINSLKKSEKAEEDSKKIEEQRIANSSKIKEVNLEACVKRLKENLGRWEELQKDIKKNPKDKVNRMDDTRDAILGDIKTYRNFPNKKNIDAEFEKNLKKYETDVLNRMDTNLRGRIYDEMDGIKNKSSNLKTYLAKSSDELKVFIDKYKVSIDDLQKKIGELSPEVKLYEKEYIAECEKTLLCASDDMKKLKEMYETRIKEEENLRITQAMRGGIAAAAKNEEPTKAKKEEPMKTKEEATEEEEEDEGEQPTEKEEVGGQPKKKKKKKKNKKRR